MACTTCKKTNADLYNESIEKDTNGVSLFAKINQYLLKFLIFLFLCAITLPFIIPITIYALFITSVLDKGINLVPVLAYLGRKMFKDEDDNDDDDEDYENIDEEYYELVDPNEITIIK